jgi:hypothetical protein
VVVHTRPVLIEVVVHSAEALRAVVRGAGNKVGRITTAGSFSEFAIPTANSARFAVAAGSDGALWFTGEALAGGPGYDAGKKMISGFCLIV